MLEKYSLPISQPAISSYSNIAIAYSILEGNAQKDFDKILCDKYVTCYYDSSEEYMQFSFPYFDHWCGDREATFYQEVNLQKITFADLNIDLVEFIKECIKFDTYVHGECNFKMLDSAWTYIDENKDSDYYLISGYDDNDQTFVVTYCDENFCVKTNKISYSLMYEALIGVPKENIRLFLIKYNKDTTIELNFTSIIRELSRYVYSENPYPEYHYTKIYGIAAVEKFFQTVLEKIENQEKIYPRYIKCLGEHKLLMLNRIRYLISNNLVSEHFENDALKVYEMSNAIVNCLKVYNKTLDKTYFYSVILLMRKMIFVERNYLEDVLFELQQNIA